MLKALFTWLGFFLCTLGYLITPNNPALAKARLAQVTSDDTVNTQVSDDGETAEITGGERAGDNLFHSFQDFSVQSGDRASFLNANDIANIFSRVTGGNISNIDGLISANGSANLFLINPAGIVFGENARLDVGGSFYGSTRQSSLS
jgi:filamentous hemagglutinin family protein